MDKITEKFASNVFTDKEMKERLPKKVYDAFKEHLDSGVELDMSTADVIASAMKNWALEKGATHYTHWFQPMTGVTAEKHDSFIMPLEDGSIITTFSGKELIKGEPDASSFPSGGLRATFEARGYTAWDPSSNVFIKGNTLCIPTAFCSYGGESLDKKTPLLLSTEALNKQALRVLEVLGMPAEKVVTTIGPEQEYFLIPKDLFMKRKDLRFCNRTLIGAKAPKSQELEDHYFGAIKTNVSAFMAELNDELWKLGVLANTEHNEVAPSQHELAPIFTTANIAADHNQLTMEIMKKVAEKHNLVCLLHEKPFAGINGSGKHINWSMADDKGHNLLKPGKEPIKNIPFLIFLAAVIKAVDKHQDLLRISVASAGNDHRLGGNEAPPAIISMFLGDDLKAVLDAIGEGKTEVPKHARTMDTKASVLPDLKKDTTDRNRTSPFAFTGSRFEFRMPGSMTSVSCPAYILNTITADALMDLANELEKADDVNARAMELVKETYLEHKRIVFNGDNYTDEWVAEAERRGLLNLHSTTEVLPYFTNSENVDLFARHKVLTETEIHARQAILYEEYAKIINIEALTLIDMVKKDIIPSVSSYIKELAEIATMKKSLSDEISIASEITLIKDLSVKIEKLSIMIESLDKDVSGIEGIEGTEECAKFFSENVVKSMKEIRALTDDIEANTASEYWPMPTYADLLFA